LWSRRELVAGTLIIEIINKEEEEFRIPLLLV
jgi:hypothetical protein